MVRELSRELELHGYALLTTPPFETAATLERGLGSLGDDLLRFIDPETGAVSAFRPDLTVQVARVVGTRLGERTPPHRLYYEGHVLRTPRGRARRQRQIAQIGAECIGVADARGDAEIVTLASRLLDRVGLEHRIEIAAVPMVRALLTPLAPERRASVADALGRKDRVGVERALHGAKLEAASERLLVELVELVGDLEVLERARAKITDEGRPHLDAIVALSAALIRGGLEPRLSFDLGEIRGFDYYTGPSFALLVEGPGEPIGGGGRYDDLLARFGRSLPASGFAIDLDHVERALEQRDRVSPTPSALGVALVGHEETPIAAALRRAGIACAAAHTDDPAIALAHARAWSLAATVSEDPSGVTVQWIDGTRERCSRDVLIQVLSTKSERGRGGAEP